MAAMPTMRAAGHTPRQRASAGNMNPRKRNSSATGAMTQMSSAEKTSATSESSTPSSWGRSSSASIPKTVTKIAEHWSASEFFLYLGRHVGLPVCLEGALKLKEISYIPTDAYAAGEMKHGPIALLD